MKPKATISSLFIILLLFSGTCRAQETLTAFGVDLNMLNEIVKISGHDSIFVSSAKEDDRSEKNTGQSYHFYNRKTKSRVFPDGYEAAYPFAGKTALVKHNNRWGLIDRNGKFVYHHPVPDIVRLSSYEKFVLFSDDRTDRIIYRMQDGSRQESSIACAMPATPDYFISKTGNGKYNLTSQDHQPVFSTDSDTIISNNRLLYKDNPDNLILAKKKNRYSLLDTEGKEITKTKYTKARFTGPYVMLSEKNQWNYYTYQNKQLHFMFSSPYECRTPAYQENAVGVFRTPEGYNILKANGEILRDYFEYISDEGTYGVKGNILFIFSSDAGYYAYTEK
ncbi:WG repeat-containing protein [uncultured Chryseobacterium sp.]|uniref:WG repeat-containing protein n=1 Tax=uncultured Chryseobacterium sp. TaxID=259322 RepID=UPI0025CF2A89|nr:WG repeat-containing protein [uncultured Chryseobacterium sp.]